MAILNEYAARIGCKLHLNFDDGHGVRRAEIHAEPQARRRSHAPTVSATVKA